MQRHSSTHVSNVFIRAHYQSSVDLMVFVHIIISTCLYRCTLYLQVETSQTSNPKCTLLTYLVYLPASYVCATLI